VRPSLLSFPWSNLSHLIRRGPVIQYPFWWWSASPPISPGPCIPLVANPCHLLNRKVCRKPPSNSGLHPSALTCPWQPTPAQSRPDTCAGITGQVVDCTPPPPSHLASPCPRASPTSAPPAWRPSTAQSPGGTASRSSQSWTRPVGDRGSCPQVEMIIQVLLEGHQVHQCLPSRSAVMH
jgi:hypothetical protein